MSPAKKGTITLDAKDLTSEARSRISGLESVKAVASQAEQSFDIVYIRPGLGIIEFRMDATTQVYADEIPSNFKLLRESFSNSINPKTKTDFMPLGTPFNLFPLIKKVYALEYGDVHSCSSISEEGGSRKESMWQKRGEENDLRNEPYHTAGKAASAGVKPYSITSFWPTPVSNDSVSTHARVSFDGKRPLANSMHSQLSEVIIERCGRVEYYETVFARILECIGEINEQE